MLIDRHFFDSQNSFKMVFYILKLEAEFPYLPVYIRHSLCLIKNDFFKALANEKTRDVLYNLILPCHCGVDALISICYC